MKMDKTTKSEALSSGKTSVKISSHENMLLTFLWNKLPFILLVILCISQVIASLLTHSIVARLTLCDTILFTIAMSRRIFTKSKENLDVFLRLAGIIAFEALIFVNFTHSMEIVFVEHHDTHISHIFLLVTAADVILKTLFLATGIFPTLGLNWMRRIILHFLASICLLSLAAVDAKMSKMPNDYLSTLDPYLGIFLSIVLTIIALPSALSLLPYLCANIPDSFKVNDFVKEMETKFPNTRCAHIHVFRQWPENNFEVIMHVLIAVDQNSPEWIQEAETTVQQIQREIRSILTRAGAQRVTIQPKICAITENFGDTWTSCTTKVCHDNDKTCCTQKVLVKTGEKDITNCL
uniref:Uncharacterized protein n=1 Tax=Panagrolaimus sp. ES5 TaxID=591445 RepID=A0AC34F4U5_9BILA